GRATLHACRDSLAVSAKSALTVGMACAIVGTIIGMMTQTGVGTIFGGWVIGLGEHSLFLALVMTMLLSILLGTGIPTIPTYIITAALAAPALAKLGVPLIVSHMFAFYYGIMADLSPPVALAALAAAPIARENPDKIGWEAMRIALAGYVIPFIAVYSPALMLQDGDPMAARIGFYGAVVYASVKALAAIGLFGMTAIGFLFTRMSVLERLLALLAAICLLGEFSYSDWVGFPLALLIVAWQWRQRPPRPKVAHA
ncbi:MAG TPA: TRAP transporter large permease subunit, partial [Rhodopseudomonas sp.]|uniref:TRAP transporter large permease subunit n=1 Tax=Rhodopseudomonas sp. TaxID=1078 RepID=UPI002EDA64B7